jgi:EpsD family peptidyl-prolyl cis-trans isomerase
MSVSSALRYVPGRVGICLPLVAVAVLLGACSGSKDDKKAAGQAVAKVNKSELTVHQINFVLSQQRGLRPEQTDAASRQILERLIDQELALQKAADQKLDRDARVVAQLEAARRDIISRAYFDRVGDGAPKPTPAEVKKYYDANPALFAERKVYQLQEINIEAAPDKARGLGDVLKKARSINEFVDYLKANGFKFAGNQIVRGAEQLPMNLLPTLSGMTAGQSVFNVTPTGGSVLVVLGARSQPVEEKQAQAVIEQFLFNDQKRRLVAQDLKSLRGAAEIKYLGKFADAAKTGVPAAPAAAVTPAEVAASAVGANPALQGATGLPMNPATAASGSLDSKTITKGLGLK